MGEGCYMYGGTGSSEMSSQYDRYVGGIAQMYAVQENTGIGLAAAQVIKGDNPRITITWSEVKFNGTTYISRQRATVDDTSSLDLPSYSVFVPLYGPVGFSVSLD